MDSEGNKDSTVDKRIVNKLFKKLTSLFYDELKTCCDTAGYRITDLLPKAKGHFQEKGSPSELENTRFLHYEEGRISKILKISTDIAANPNNHLYRSQSTISLIKQLGIPVNSQHHSSKAASLSLPEHFKLFLKPQDVIQNNYEKEKEKYEKSLNMIEKISSIKEAERKKNEMKIKIMEDREKKLKADREKIKEEHEKNTEQKVEKRKQILQKKYQIQNTINYQCSEIGDQLEERMKQLSEREKKILRQKIKKKQDKIKEWINHDFQKIIMDEIKIKQEEEKAEKMVKELQKKIEKHVKTYEKNVRNRIQTARTHSVKVEKQFFRSLREENEKQEEKLKKFVNKTISVEEKKDKKLEKFQENSEKLKNQLENSFNRQLRGVRYVNEAEVRRLEEIEQRESEKRKTFNVIKSKIEKLYEEKKTKNGRRERNHSEQYNKTQEIHIRHKEKIIEKHHRLSQVAEEIKNHNDLLSNLKRRRNYEVQDARSSYSSPAKYKNLSISVDKDLDSFENN